MSYFIPVRVSLCPESFVYWSTHSDFPLLKEKAVLSECRPTQLGNWVYSLDTSTFRVSSLSWSIPQSVTENRETERIDRSDKIILLLFISFFDNYPSVWSTKETIFYQVRKLAVCDGILLLVASLRCTKSAEPGWMTLTRNRKLLMHSQRTVFSLWILFFRILLITYRDGQLRPSPAPVSSSSRHFLVALLRFHSDEKTFTTAPLRLRSRSGTRSVERSLLSRSGPSLICWPPLSFFSCFLTHACVRLLFSS
jgi:hypothetical protein